MHYKKLSKLTAPDSKHPWMARMCHKISSCKFVHRGGGNLMAPPPTILIECPQLDSITLRIASVSASVKCS